MRAVRTFQAAACAGSLALIAIAAPCSFGQNTQEDSATSTTTQQQGPTLEQLQKQIDELQKQVNILRSRGPDSPEARAVKTGKTSTPVPPPVSAPAAVVASAEPATTATESATSGSKNPHSEPFAFADFTWLNGNARTKDTPYATNFFTPEVRADVSYTYDYNHPADDTIVGSS